MHTVCHSVPFPNFLIPKLNGVVHKTVWHVTGRPYHRRSSRMRPDRTARNADARPRAIPYSSSSSFTGPSEAALYGIPAPFHAATPANGNGLKEEGTLSGRERPVWSSRSPEGIPSPAFPPATATPRASRTGNHAARADRPWWSTARWRCRAPFRANGRPPPQWVPRQ